MNINQTKNDLKKGLKAEMEKENFRRIPQKKKLSSLILIVPLSQSIHKSIEM